jgi:hypothetical protein
MANFQKDGLWVQGGAANLANVDETEPYVPGQLGKVQSIRRDNGQKQPQFFQYVQRYTTDSETLVAGHPLYWVDLDDFIVSGEQTDGFGGTTNPIVAGVALGAKPSAGKFGFIQVGGLASVAVTDTVVAGDRLQVADNDQFKSLAAISITSQAVSVPVNAAVQAIAVGAVETSTESAIVAQLTLFRNGW